MRDLKVRGLIDRSGSVSPFLAIPLIFMTSLKPEPLANPLLSKWLRVLKDAGLSHLSVPLRTKQGQQPWDPVVPVDLGRS